MPTTDLTISSIGQRRIRLAVPKVGKFGTEPGFVVKKDKDVLTLNICVDEVDGMESSQSIGNIERKVRFDFPGD